MEHMLANLFAYQRFAENPRLQSIIDETHRRSGCGRLSDEQLELVSAAGDPAMLAQLKHKREEKT